MRHTFYPTLPANDCAHGEPRDRRTSTGEPACPLCRTAARRRTPINPDAVDYQALAARDDLWDDEPEDIEPSPQTGSLVLGSLFAHDAGHRMARMLDQWRTEEPQGILF